MGDRMAKELGLSDDQKAKMKVLGQAERAEMEALRDQSSKLRDEQRAKFESIHKGYMEKRQAIMTPEQREKAGKMREQMRGKMQERMERMHDRGERRRGGPPGRT